MREIQVLVTVQVDEDDPNTKIDRGAMEKAAIEAVENAVRFAESVGFEHSSANELSIGFVDAVLYESESDDEEVESDTDQQD
jgi:hypothetical protein